MHFSKKQSIDVKWVPDNVERWYVGKDSGSRARKTKFKVSRTGHFKLYDLKKYV